MKAEVTVLLVFADPHICNPGEMLMRQALLSNFKNE